MQSAQYYYELNKPTKEWVFNSQLLDDDVGMYKTQYKPMCKDYCIVSTKNTVGY